MRKARYKYRARRGPEELVEGFIWAETQDEAVDKVNALGLLPVDIREDEGRDAERVSSSRRSKISSHQLVVFFRHLARLLKSGVPILRSLSILAEQAGSLSMKELLDDIQARVREGESLSYALADHPQIFSAFDVALINAGESAGTLDEVLNRIAVYREGQESFLRKVRGAIVYPMFLLGAGLATVFFMLTFVIPRFSQFFNDLQQELPLPTRVLIVLSHWLQSGWVLFAIAIFVLLLWMKRALKNKKERSRLDGSLLKFPKLGKFIIKIELIRLCRTIALLLKNGVPILTAVRISIPVLGNEAVRNELELYHKALQEGGLLSEIFRETRFFPPLVHHLVKVGEESGRLDEVLMEIADWYEQEIDSAVQTATRLLEPILILTIGLVLSFFIIALLLPVFSINAIVQ